MDLHTRFQRGDDAFTIDTKTLKMVHFKVYGVSVFAAKDEPRVTLYPDNDDMCGYATYPESKCFHTEDELKAHVFGQKANEIA